MPPIWPRIQLFGSGLGQNGSTRYPGTSSARQSCGLNIHINATAPNRIACLMVFMFFSRFDVVGALCAAAVLRLSSRRRKACGADRLEGLVGENEFLVAKVF